MDKIKEYLSLQKAIFLICFIILVILQLVCNTWCVNSVSRAYFSQLIVLNALLEKQFLN